MYGGPTLSHTKAMKVSSLPMLLAIAIAHISNAYLSYSLAGMS